MSTKNTGDAGENVAAEYLMKLGYRILERKYRCSYGEIDIIAEKKGTISFVEVKTRSSLLFGTPAESVDLRKQKKIINCSQYYIIKNNCGNKNFSYDVAEVYITKNETDINYINNAFEVF